MDIEREGMSPQLQKAPKENKSEKTEEKQTTETVTEQSGKQFVTFLRP